MAKPFQPIGAVAINVLARLAARKAAVEQFRQRGIKHYRHVELLQQASEYLARHPELFEQALATAWELATSAAHIDAIRNFCQWSNGGRGRV